MGGADLGKRCYLLFLNSGKFAYACNNGYTSNVNAVNDKIYYITSDLSPDNQKLIVDGETIVTSNESAFIRENVPISILGYQLSSIKEIAKVKLYQLTIKLNNILIRDFIPCYRISDNKKGLYDFVEGKFYANQGSGDDFIAGPEV